MLAEKSACRSSSPASGRLRTAFLTAIPYDKSVVSGVNTTRAGAVSMTGYTLGMPRSIIGSGHAGFFDIRWGVAHVDLLVDAAEAGLVTAMCHSAWCDAKVDKLYSR